MDNRPKCEACDENYDKVQRRPRSLTCGHTFCSQCIEESIKKVITCPTCKAEHRATAVTQFPINCEIEALIKDFKGAQLTSAEALSAKPCQDRTKGISKKLWSSVQEHKSSISNLITKCEEALSQLVQYQGQVRDWKTQHHQLHDRLHELVEKNKAVIELLEQEDTRVVNMATEGETTKKQLHTRLECLDTVNTAKEIAITISEDNQYKMEAEDWTQKCQEDFPDVSTVYTSVKVHC
ncbi:hypothetical protein OTU49_013307 [Cherax quadricarinatus]|uniref:RING-type domain-containing protein n=1 Tax=Cherax quadricarinatus TaxID=27406 RepID=A0AAW0VV41_CHEQU|nr:E3 ubiquitin-protein ligase TRIM31-like [Cherax quadricarinatus]